MTDSLKKLSTILQTIQDTSLEAHQRLELKGMIPLYQFEHIILGNRQFDNDVRARILWHFMIFSRARTVSQQELQNAVGSRLPDHETSFVMRQLLCASPRVWSFRRSYEKSFAHTISGPGRHKEISVCACLSVTGDIDTREHLYAYGWTLSFGEEIYLIFMDALSTQQVQQIEQYRPFPLQLNDNDFWEENEINILKILYPMQFPCSILMFSNPEKTTYMPDAVYQKLQKILISSLSGNVAFMPTLPEIAATHDAKGILEIIQDLVNRQHLLTQNAEKLKTRLLEAIGCDTDGNMPKAHDSLLMADPIALLLLPNDHPVFEVLHERDSIRLALRYEEEHGGSDITDAFKRYRRERRWLAAFPCFDFSIESHAAQFGIPMHSLERIFDSKLFSSSLPIVPQGDVLRQLQNRYGFYQQDSDPPKFSIVLDTINSRGFNRSLNMAAIAQWIVSYCDRYRYCLCKIEPEAVVQRSIDKSNQKLLNKGLQDLAKMFKK